MSEFKTLVECMRCSRETKDESINSELDKLSKLLKDNGFIIDRKDVPHKQVIYSDDKGARYCAQLTNGGDVVNTRYKLTKVNYDDVDKDRSIYQYRPTDEKVSHIKWSSKNAQHAQYLDNQPEVDK